MSEEYPDNFEFSAEPKSWKCTIPFITPEGKLAPRQCILREASEDAYTAYKNVSMRALTFTADEKTTERKGHFTGGAEADTVLISRCLFELVGVGPMDAPTGQVTERLIPIDQIKKLPRSITSRLYNWLKINSAIEEEVETAEFLTKRIESDQAKLSRLVSKGTPGKGEGSSISSTSG